ncbi:hypothetical protein JG687_00013377 [Phytophthora cactorum]|uniref:Uncharacterized protein n=1 Tax=Phytophthora cactorum TaxID=29920 RepID=A0A8T1U224_9STRA|nr:hypothetical protein JG687_00013377 [Phytophthora cactorum]
MLEAKETVEAKEITEAVATTQQPSVSVAEVVLENGHEPDVWQQERPAAQFSKMAKKTVTSDDDEGAADDEA